MDEKLLLVRDLAKPRRWLGTCYLCGNTRSVSPATAYRMRVRGDSRCHPCTIRTLLMKPIEDIPDKVIILKQVSSYDEHSTKMNAYALVQCPDCGEKREKLRSDIRRWKSTVCFRCSRQRQRGWLHPRWKHGFTGIHDVAWKDWANHIRDRDNRTCRRCLRPESEFKEVLHVHHIIPWQTCHISTEDNLISLCRSCHAWAENNLDESTALFQTLS